MGKEKYCGIFPAFYGCYDKNGEISTEGVKAFARWLRDKSVQGLYVGGSSGECIYQTVEERKKVLEAVMEAVGDDLVIIAHVACNSTKESIELARHAESLGVDAIASIPPIYFRLPDEAIAQYWNDISSAAPNTDFFIYNIPQLAGVSLNIPLLKKMLENPRCIGVKNSSMPVQDIQMWTDEGALVFNGPDEQLFSGLCAGAVGGIGGTYGAMPQLYLAIYNAFKEGNIEKAKAVQNECCRIIYKMCSGKSNMYAMIKETLRILGAPDCGDARKPFIGFKEEERPIALEIADMIQKATEKYC